MGTRLFHNKDLGVGREGQVMMGGEKHHMVNEGAHHITKMVGIRHEHILHMGGWFLETAKSGAVTAKSTQKENGRLGALPLQHPDTLSGGLHTIPLHWLLPMSRGIMIETTKTSWVVEPDHESAPEVIRHPDSFTAVVGSPHTHRPVQTGNGARSGTWVQVTSGIPYPATGRL